MKIQRLSGSSKYNDEKLKKEYLKNIKIEKYTFKDYEQSVEYFKSIHKKINHIINRKIFTENILKEDYLANEEKIKTLINKFKVINDVHSSFSYVFDEFESIKSFILNKSKISKSKIKIHFLFARFVTIFAKSSIGIENLIKPLNELKFIDKAKLSFLKLLVKKPSLIFIDDDLNLTDINLKNELLRVINELSDMHNTSYIFLTNDKRVIKNEHFDYVYLFADNKELEHGTNKEVFKNTVNPYLKSLLNDEKNYKKMELYDFYDYNFFDEFKINSKHYIISNFKEYKD
ncbi:UNVERIFIED_CONTAM: hypothetical protein O8I53_13895 [Campylobacter lari]